MITAIKAKITNLKFDNKFSRQLLSCGFRTSPRDEKIKAHSVVREETCVIFSKSMPIWDTLIWELLVYSFL